MKISIAVLMVTSLFFVPNAFALNFIDSYWDLNTIDGAYFNVDDGVTEAFSQLSYDAQTTSLIDLVGGTVSDSGLAYVTAMTPVSLSIPPDDEGLNGGAGNYGMTIVWNNLTGNITSLTPTNVQAQYTSGTFDFYIDYDPYSLTLGNQASFTDGAHVATIELTEGSYFLSLDGSGGSSYSLLGEFTVLIDDFWFMAGTDTDLADLVDLGFLLGYSFGDNDPASVQINEIFNGGQDPIALEVFSDHNSSLELAVVPEPSTFLLLGTGLVGVSILGYRRKKRS